MKTITKKEVAEDNRAWAHYFALKWMRDDKERGYYFIRHLVHWKKANEKIFYKKI